MLDNRADIVHHSLKNHGVDDEVAGMFEMGEITMQLPQEEKIKYEQGADEGGSFGFVDLNFID